MGGVGIVLIKESLPSRLSVLRSYWTTVTKECIKRPVRTAVLKNRIFTRTQYKHSSILRNENDCNTSVFCMYLPFYFKKWTDDCYTSVFCKKAKGQKRRLQNFISVCRVLQSWGGNKLRAAVCKFREFAVKTEISKSFIFSQRKPFSETFSKITIKVSKEFLLKENRQKVKCCPTPYCRRSKTFELYLFSKPSGRKTVQGNKFIFSR